MGIGCGKISKVKENSEIPTSVRACPVKSSKRTVLGHATLLEGLLPAHNGVWICSIRMGGVDLGQEAACRARRGLECRI